MFDSKLINLLVDIIVFASNNLPQYQIAELHRKEIIRTGRRLLQVDQSDRRAPVFLGAVDAREAHGRARGRVSRERLGFLQRLRCQVKH